jgi:hypothetical protein
MMLAVLFLPLLLIAVGGILRVFTQTSAGRPPLSKEDAALQQRLRRAGAGVLAVGLLAAALIYLLAPEPKDGGAIGYEISNGSVYPIMPGESKGAERQAESVAGKAGIFASELAGWFRGKNLAYAVALLAVGGSLGCFVFAQLLRPGGESGLPSDQA